VQENPIAQTVHQDVHRGVVQVVGSGREVVVRVWGKRLGIEEGRQLGAALERAIGDGVRRVVVELPEVEWVSSLGFGVIVRAWRVLQAVGGEVRVRGSEAVRERVERAGFGRALLEGDRGNRGVSSRRERSGSPKPKSGRGGGGVRRGLARKIRWIRTISRWFASFLDAVRVAIRRRARQRQAKAAEVRRARRQRERGRGLALWRQGLSMAEIGRRVGWSRQRVRYTIKRYAADSTDSTNSTGGQG